MLQLLQNFQKKLTNLTSSNRSLYLPRLSAENDIDLADFEYVSPSKTAFSLLEDIIIRNKKVLLSPYIDSRDAENNQISKRLQKIFHKSTLVQQERGAKDLYLGYPFVEGRLNSGQYIRCPLLFFPVSLSLSSSKSEKLFWQIAVREEELPTFNKSFLLAYSYYNKVSLDEALHDFQLEDPFDDLLSFRNSLYQLLKDSKIELNFNSDTFSNQLKQIIDFKAEEMEASYAEGQLKMQPQAVLGLFPQAGSFIYADYEQWIQECSYADTESFFVEKSSEKPASLVKEEHVLNIFPIDASQEDAILAIKRGKSIVVQGPPGTGKSQLIASLAGDFAAAGKNVLIVCQKRAAIDVVYQRLSKKGLDAFAGLVHDFKNDRKALYELISKQINELESYENQNNALDTIWLEREFLQTCRTISETAEQLSNFKNALFHSHRFGISPKELYLKCQKPDTIVDIQAEVKQIHYNELENLLSTFGELHDYHKIIEKNAPLWLERVSFSHFGGNDMVKISEQISLLEDFQKKLNHDWEMTKNLVENNDFFAKTDKIIADTEAKPAFELLNKSNVKTLKKSITKALNLYSSPLLDIVDFGNIYKIKEELIQAKNLLKNPLKALFWKALHKNSIFIEVLHKGEKVTLQSVESYIALADKAIEYINETDVIKGYLPVNEDKFDSTFLQKLRKTIEFYEYCLTFPLCSEWIEKDVFFEEYAHISVLKNIYEAQKVLWNKYLGTSILENILSGSQSAEDYRKQIAIGFDIILAFDSLFASLPNAKKAIFSKCNSAHFDKKSFIRFVENNILYTYIFLLEDEKPVLRMVSTPQIQNLEDRLQKMVVRKQELSTQIVLLKLRERTYKNTAFNRLNNRTTYRELLHQVTKKKKIWPLRKLIENFSGEVYDLIPIWLASPETVSAVFPFKIDFDLVIFDEASQCFAEKAFPAMYRGKQVVIVGDSKQLQPNDLYQPRYETDDEGNMDTETDSILSLAIKYLPQTMLRSHYRSKESALINFSNRHFYNHKLHILPDYEQIKQKNTPLKYLNVHGIWEKQANKTEAEKILELCIDLLKNKPEKEIGVVTFNSTQAALIEQIFDDYAASNGYLFPESLFIKNIENVQGDERDIILFSTAYAPDKSGKMQMQFGSLNQLHGENRLNVAITRAKEEIYVVTSIYPSQLQVENSLNNGPKLLKKYLEYVYEASQGHLKEVVFERSFSNGWYLKSALLSRNKSLLPSPWPFADLRHGEGNELILTDDELFYSALSAKDAFAYLPLQLKSKNWHYERMFSRVYFENNNKK